VGVGNAKWPRVGAFFHLEFVKQKVSQNTLYDMNSSPPIPIGHKEWAKHLRQLVGGSASVTAYYDEPNQNKIHVFSSSNNQGIVAATVGLMDINQTGRSDIEIYSEIIMDQKGHDEKILNVLSTIAFCVMKDGWRVAPGVVFYDVVAMYAPNKKLPHVMFTAPFQWDSMSKIGLSEKTIYPLIAIPISEAESKIAEANAGRDLEDLWMKHSTDVLDWGRESAA
jgi:hypothetical protein